MPIYEYRCQRCGTKFEKLVRDRSGAPPECPACGHGEVKLELSVFATVSSRSSPPACARPGCAEMGCPEASTCQFQ